MNRHYDRYLVKKYAPLYRDRHGDARATLMCFGFEVGDGWFDIINTLSYLLCSEWLSVNDRYKFLRDNIGKPKFPWSGEDDIITEDDVREEYEKLLEEEKKVPIAIQVKEKYGTLRFYVAGATDEHISYITFAESMSAVTCEVCGKRGKRNYDGWIMTRCSEHRW